MKATYRTMSKILILGAMLISMLGFTSMQTVMAQTNSIKLERVASSYAHISHVVISPTDSALQVRGNVHKRWHKRGRIRGHVNIAVIAPDGTLLFEDSIRHIRRGTKQQGARFFVEIPVEVSAGSVVRIAHHDVPMLD